MYLLADSNDPFIWFLDQFYPPFPQKNLDLLGAEEWYFVLLGQEWMNYFRTNSSISLFLLKYFNASQPMKLFCCFLSVD